MKQHIRTHIGYEVATTRLEFDGGETIMSLERLIEFAQIIGKLKETKRSGWVSQARALLTTARLFVKQGLSLSVSLVLRTRHVIERSR